MGGIAKIDDPFTEVNHPNLNFLMHKHGSLSTFLSFFGSRTFFELGQNSKMPLRRLFCCCFEFGVPLYIHARPPKKQQISKSSRVYFS